MNCIHPVETRYSAYFLYSLGNPDLLLIAGANSTVEVRRFVFIEISLRPMD
jgi:hypothetical protein